MCYNMYMGSDYYVFLSFIIYISVSPFLFFIYLTIAGLFTSERVIPESDDRPRVEIIIPAFNEARVIKKTLHVLSSLDYPDYYVKLIDDCSEDETASIAESTDADISVVRLDKRIGKSEIM
ncbi:MAG: glycosyltransferase, partial [Candidatus Muiribacteriaceae bacterium]